MSTKRISPHEYENLCSWLMRLRIEGEGDGKHAKTGTEFDCGPDAPEPSAIGPGQSSEVGPAGKEPASSPEIIPPPSISFVPGRTTPEGRLNRTEHARHSYLKMLGVRNLRIQAVTLMLGFDCRYTPDLSYIDENGMFVFEEVKGFRRDDAMVKLRVAARLFNEFRFKLVARAKAGWNVKEVKP